MSYCYCFAVETYIKGNVSCFYLKRVSYRNSTRIAKVLTRVLSLATTFEYRYFFRIESKLGFSLKECLLYCC